MKLPFSGPAAFPPPLAMYLAVEHTAHDTQRPRLAVDARGYDCNDYAYDAWLGLKADGRTAYYVDCVTEDGEPHMIAAYPTGLDGAVYCIDNRAGPDPVTADHLEVRGYRWISASKDGILWYAAPSA